MLVSCAQAITIGRVPGNDSQLTIAIEYLRRRSRNLLQCGRRRWWRRRLRGRRSLLLLHGTLTSALLRDLGGSDGQREHVRRQQREYEFGLSREHQMRPGPLPLDAG